jgi:ATP/maltotriose-dependent transcriptional regulator MalT
MNQIHAVSDKLVLVLHDYRLTSAQPVHDTVTFLIDRASENTHLTIATRADPPHRLEQRHMLASLNSALEAHQRRMIRCDFVHGQSHEDLIGR